ncbi:MAG: peptide deformylase [Oscillospiraceae bacterium]|nr:peptide deformylase [Oscillospiraceae bacterium]
MIRPICTDTVLLAKPAARANNSDLQTARDLADTLLANRSRCVGMASNMIGIPKCIIAIMPPGMQQPLVMLNPQIIARSGEYEVQEGCLSLKGERTAKRYRKLTVKWLDMTMHPQKRSFEGYPAQIIQHEIDHCAGILI